jgi:hypothetical protein
MLVLEEKGEMKHKKPIKEINQSWVKMKRRRLLGNNGELKHKRLLGKQC